MIGGWIDGAGNKVRGTAGWTPERFEKGRYFIKPDNGGTVVSIVATLHVDDGETKNILKAGHTKEGWGYVYIYNPTDNIFGQGTDGPFNFIATVE